MAQTNDFIGAEGQSVSKSILVLRQTFTRSNYADTFRRYWKAYDKTSQSGKSFRVGKPPYPTEQGITFLSAWLCTGEDTYRTSAVSQFEFAHPRENDDGLLIAEKGFCRDFQARQIFNFFTAYRILGDRKYLTWADHCAKGMIDHLERRSHEVLGKSFTTFVAGFCSADKPYSQSHLKPWADVNQNAENALAFTLLYFEPRSAFYKAHELVEIIRNEMEAGLALQDSKTGAISFAESPERINQYDTDYGSFVLFSWVWLNLHWKNADWQKRIEHSGQWIAGFSSGKGIVANRYPHAGNLQPEHYLLGGEVWFRVPILWKIGMKPDGLINRYVSTYALGDMAYEGAPMMFPYFEVMGIPPGFYLPK